MAKSIPAIITPEVLAWARNLDGITIDDIAAKLHTAPEKILSWEQGTSYPTVTQAKNLAKQYRVPFVYFYLPDTPKKLKRLEKTDYRTFGNNGNSIITSRELRWFLRDIEDRRDAVLSLYEEEKRKPLSFPIKLSAGADMEEVAAAIRNLLELTEDIQCKFRKPEVALSHCIRVLEKWDVLIFQATKIAPSEFFKQKTAYEIMPIIALNRKDEPSARLFTLCHELVHIVTRTSGICNDVNENSVSQNVIEMKCNQIAGKILVPLNELSSHPTIGKIRKYGFDDSYVYQVSRDFAVSKEVILHALWEMKIITRENYFDILARYIDEYKSYKAKKKGGFLPPATDTGTQVGKLYARTILNAYYTDKISARDASGYLLNLKTKNFEKLERWCF
mgnify:FL=1